MRIEIDQSGKIENTEIDTVVAYSNHDQVAVRISAKNKKKIQQFFRKSDKPHVFVYKTFAVLIFLLIEGKLNKIQQIIIDIEYIGWSHQVKDYLLQNIRKRKKNFDKNDITFHRIGKKSRAHSIAYTNYRKQNKIARTVTLENIKKYL